MKKKVLIFVVAYNAEKTIEWVISRVPAELIGSYDLEVLIIDDSSSDKTFETGVALSDNNHYPFKIKTLFNPVNQGYGGNQKIGYHYAILNKFDYVVLMHGDGQYPPEFIPQLLKPLIANEADAVFGSRMIKPLDALKGGMPFYKFIGNKILTRIQNLVLGSSLSEFHSGFRIYSVDSLKKIPFERNSNDYDFDTEIIIQFTLAKLNIVELPIPTYYGDEVCHVNGMKYALDVLKDSIQARAQKISLFYDVRFDCEPQNLQNRDKLKLDFDSAYTRVIRDVAPGSNVLQFKMAGDIIGAALEREKNCHVVSLDISDGHHFNSIDVGWFSTLDERFPENSSRKIDYILLIDIIENLNDPVSFLDNLRKLAAKDQPVILISTANIAFILMRLLLLVGRFEYSKRGILDLLHRRLYTLKTLKRLLVSTGYNILSVEGISLPAPLVLGNNIIAKAFLILNELASKIFPSLFGFQLYFRAKALPTLETLLADANNAADVKRKL